MSPWLYFQSINVLLGDTLVNHLSVKVRKKIHTITIQGRPEPARGQSRQVGVGSQEDPESQDCRKRLD